MQLPSLICLSRLHSSAVCSEGSGISILLLGLSASGCVCTCDQLDLGSGLLKLCRRPARRLTGAHGVLSRASCMQLTYKSAGLKRFMARSWLGESQKSAVQEHLHDRPTQSSGAHAWPTAFLCNFMIVYVLGRACGILSSCSGQVGMGSITNASKAGMQELSPVVYLPSTAVIPKFCGSLQSKPLGCNLLLYFEPQHLKRGFMTSVAGRWQ